MHQRITTSTTMSTQTDQRGPIEAFNALVAENNLTVEEWDANSLPQGLRDKFWALCIEDRRTDRKIIVVPVGQDPAQRLAAVRAFLAHQGVAA